MTLEQHLGCDHQVHVNPQRHPLECLTHITRFRHHLEKVSPGTEQEIQLSFISRVQHFHRVQSFGSREWKPIFLLEGGNVFFGQRLSSRQRGGVRAHLATALNARVSTNGHQAAAATPHKPLSQRQINDGSHVVLTASVLGDAHTPHQHGFFSLA